MLKEVIAELKKPTILEQQALDKTLAEVIAANEERKTNAAGILMQLEQKRTTQKWCSHKHPAAVGGQSHGVLISEQGNPSGYILCQACQVKVRPEPAPKGYEGIDIYSTQLFNQLIQDLPSQNLFQ
jgi:hypothetical protein